MSEQKLFYLRKHGAYYGHDFKGYVSDFISAGRYTKEEAENACNRCSDVAMHEINIEAHNREIDNRVKDLLRLKIFKPE